MPLCALARTLRINCPTSDQAPDIQRQQQRMQHQDRQQAGERAVGDVNNVAGNRDQAQRNHGLQIKGAEDQHAADITQDFKRGHDFSTAENRRLFRRPHH